MGYVGADAYSRTVLVLKIALPLGALALLSTLFLLARQTDPDLRIPYADVDVDRFAQSELLASPEYSNVWADGTAMLLLAEEARPHATEPSVVEADVVDARVDMPDGRVAYVDSKSGWLHQADEVLHLVGDVVVVTEDGYRIESDHLIAEMRDSRVISEVPVIVQMPHSTVYGGNMVAERTGLTANGLRAVFKGGVRTVYQARPVNRTE